MKYLKHGTVAGTVASVLIPHPPHLAGSRLTPKKWVSSRQGSQVGLGSCRGRGGSHAAPGLGWWSGCLRISHWFSLGDLWKVSAPEYPILKPSASSTSPSTYGPISAQPFNPLVYTHYLQPSLPIHCFSPTDSEFFQTYRKVERKQPTLTRPSHRVNHC